VRCRFDWGDGECWWCVLDGEEEEERFRGDASEASLSM